MKLISEIYGDYIDGSSVVYRKKSLFLEKGLSLDNGLNIFLGSKYFGDYYCGLAPVEFDHSFGYLKRDGTPAFEFIYKIGDDFKEDRAFVSDNNNLFLIDTFGNQIKQFELSFTANQFSNGLARISSLNNSGNLKTDGFIDKDGRYVIPCIAEYMIEDPLDLIDDNDDYSDGFIRIKQNGKYGFIDENISVRIPFVYDWASKFVSGIAAVKKDNKFGFINTHNYLVFYSQWRPSVLIYTFFIGGFLYWVFDRKLSNSIFFKTLSRLSFFVFFIHVIILEQLWYWGFKSIFSEKFVAQLWFDPVFFLSVAGVSFGLAFIAHKIPYLSKITG